MKRTTFLVASAASAAFAALPLRVRAAASDLTLATPTGDLAGTLEHPDSPAAVPVVLIIAGSGPTDRDGNNPLLPGKNDSNKLLAQGLLARGVASLRYDKRGIAASASAMHAESDLRFDTYVDDAVAWITDLRRSKRFSRIIIAGHSEGSLIGMLAAVRGGADGYASLEGAGRPAADLVRAQIAKSPGVAPELRARADHLLDELSAGRPVAEVDGAFAALFRPSVQPYLISWFTYDPAREIAKVRTRAAIVQGTADRQTSPAEGELLHAGLPSARYVVVDGMNHVLKHAPDVSDAGMIAGYTNPALPVEPAVIDAVAAVALRT